MANHTSIQTARIVSASGDGGSRAIQEEVVQLFGEVRTPLLRYLYSLGLPVADGEDVAQDAFVELFRHLCAGKPRDNLRAWLFRVARNLALRRLQQVRGHVDVIQDWTNTPDRSASPEEQAVQNQRDRAMRAVIAALPPLDRQCLQLRAEGLRYREIAGVLDISLGSVAASLSRSLARISRATQPEK